MASSSLAVKVLPEIERSAAFGAITAGFLPLGTPTEHPAIQVAFQNQTDVTLSFSWDGVNSAISLAAGTSYVFDVQANKGVANALMIAQGTQFYVRQAAGAPTLGSAFISVFYAATNQGVA